MSLDNDKSISVAEDPASEESFYFRPETVRGTMTSESEGRKNRFCPHCGLSLVPLDRPHVSRDCDECGETVHLVEPGEGGEGIRVRAGDRFTIPSGWMKLSLDPAVGGKLFRPGVGFLLKKLVFSGGLSDEEDFYEILEHYEETADEILEDSEELEDLDLDTDDGAQEAIERLKKQSDSREWFAILLGAFTSVVRGAIEDEDAARAAWAMRNATAAHSMTVVRESVFEQTLWRGYLANRVVYDAASAASATPGEAEALRELSQVFDRVDEATLHAWIHSGLPVGPRIGVTMVQEELIQALAEWHLSSIERKREDERRAEEDRKFIRNLRVKWASAGASAAGVIVAALKAGGVL